MYSVYVQNAERTYPIYEPLDGQMQIFDTMLTLEMGCAGTFVFQIFDRHPYFDKIKALESEITVLKDGKGIFYGRVLKPENDFDNIYSITCEGELNYLKDSVQRPYVFTGNIPDFIGKILAVHNQQMDSRKKIYPGTITVTDSNSYIRRSNQYHLDTLETLKTRISDIHGGYFHIRHAAGKKYLDYVWDYGGINPQQIRFGENLLDFTRYMDASGVITCLIPIGADIEYEDELGETQTKTIDITSVNNGKDYIENKEAISLYGRIWGYQKWEDVTIPKNLLAKAQAYLRECAALPVSMEINAVDLSVIDAKIEEFQIGFWTDVYSEPHKIGQKFLLSKMEIDLMDSGAGSITLGKVTETLNRSAAKTQKSLSDRIEKVSESASEEINRKVENATTLITGGFGGYVVLDNINPDTGKKMHPWRILIMNTPDKETAQNIIQINQNGIGFSTTGINGPYRNAWTIDGNLVADFVTTGSMLADRVRGGTLEVGGKGLGKDGQITLKDKDGGILAVMDRNGMDIRKGSIVGSTIVLGGRGNVQGSMTVNAADGGVVCSIGGAGLYAIRGTVGGWDITDDLLSSERGMIASYEGTNHNNRATMNNASFKIWVGGTEKCYMGRGGYNGRGSEDAGLLFVSGYGGGIELDGNSGKVNAGGDMEAQGRIRAHGGMECEGSFSASGRVYMTDSVEVSRDLMCGGRVDAQNISDLAGRIEALERKIGT